MARYLYSELANAVQARLNCKHGMECFADGADNTGNYALRAEWFDRWTDRIESLVSEHMPSGSGFDCGTKLDLDASHAEKLVFTTSFHHMDGDSGMYSGWTEHTVTVTPSFIGGFNLRVSGRNRNDIKEYVADTFNYALGTEITSEVV